MHITSASPVLSSRFSQNTAVEVTATDIHRPAPVASSSSWDPSFAARFSLETPSTSNSAQ